jgi:TonB family protein
MRRPAYARSLLLSSGTHAVLGALLAGLALFHGCSRSTDVNTLPVELIVEVPDFGQPEPEAVPEPEVSKPEVPEPPPEPTDVPEPEPEKKKPEKPPEIKKEEPKKEKPAKPKVEVSKKRVVRPLPKPTTTRKTTLTPEEIAKAIRQGAKTGQRSSLSDADLRRLLSTDTKFGNGRPIDQEFVYLEMVRQILYRSWDQPGSLGVVGLTTRVELTLAPDGSILASRIVGGSGNATMDNSVMQAVRSVRRLTGVPADFLISHRRLTVAFELTGDG